MNVWWLVLIFWAGWAGGRGEQSWVQRRAQRRLERRRGR